MSGAIFLVGAAVFGIGLVRRFLSLWLNRAELVLWGLVIGWSGGTAVGYVAARVSGGVSFRVGLVVTALVWCAAIFCWLPVIKRFARRGGLRGRPVWDKGFAPFALTLGLFAIIYLRLFTTHMLPVRGDGGIYSGGESTSYDMAYHAAVTTSFVYGSNFPPLYTPMPPAPLLYPFLPDFLTALLIVLGMDLHCALVCTAVPLCLALTGIFYLFALRMLSLTGLSSPARSRLDWMAATATVLFFLNGGFGFVYLVNDWRGSGTSLWHCLTNLNVNYTHIAEKGLVWPNLITDMLLPQRTSIFGLSLGFIILTSFAIAWQRTDHAPTADKPNPWPLLLAAGVIAGTLPFFHIHSYAAVGFISGFLFFLRPRKVWLVFWIPAVALALPRYLELGGQLATAGFTRLQPGWRGQDEPSWLLFWVRNVGLPALLILPAWFSAANSLRRFYLGFLALLILALVFVFSPNDYDNVKLMVYWYGATCVVIAAWLARLASFRSGLVCSVALTFVSTLSGALAIAYEWRASKLIFTRDEIAAAEFVKTGTAPRSLFLTAPGLHQPVLSLAGRAIVRGPTAWLWSHGYPFAEREADVRAIYSGREDAVELLKYYRVDYVYLGPAESAYLNANPAFFDNHFPLTYRAGDIAIYDTRQAGANKLVASAAYPPREYAARLDRDPAQILAEFPAVAFELYRLHKAAFGGRPRFKEFMTDLGRLGRNLYVGAPGWREILEANKRALGEEWRQRPGFDERSIESNAHGRLNAAEYNAAYVLCHYFGYLRRDPDDPPDHDLTGYNFWLRQLDRTNDYRGVTRAFIEADEYKQQIR